MTQDEIICMARECGGVADDKTIVLYHEELERFAALVAAHEREACAKVCDVVVMDRVFNASDEYQNGRDMGATVCAAAIRARKS